MKLVKLFILVLLVCSYCNTAFSQQNDTWMYIRAKDSTFAPSFTKNADTLIYAGNNTKLANTLSGYTVYNFKKTLKKAKKEYLSKTFFVRANSPALLDDLLKLNTLFVSGEIIPEEDKKIYEPNDYGLTSTIGTNEGLDFNLDYLDVMQVPKAWYYTTGSRDVIIGISDGAVDTTSLDFKGKTRILTQSSVSNGHGYSISANAAAQGDNGFGIPGVCYDCSIVGTKYSQLKYVIEAAKGGARVVNCSWVVSKKERGQAIIDSLYNEGVIVVAGAGNQGWEKFKGDRFYFPASYDHVISVSSVQHRHENYTDNIKYQKKNKKPYVANIRGYLGRTAGFKNDDIKTQPRIYDVSTATLNSEVDLLAPTVGLFRYSQFLLKGDVLASEYSTTSGATPLVSGTIGLMYSLNPCLPHDEVESILKMTAFNIDHIEANKRFRGMYGAGMLNTGGAVELVHQLYQPFETAYIENQNFSRWDFKITALSKKVLLQNQKFTDDAKLLIKAKNQIVLSKNTHLKPNYNGQIRLAIDSTLTKKCDLRYRDESVILQE